MKNTFS